MKPGLSTGPEAQRVAHTNTATFSIRRAKGVETYKVPMTESGGAPYIECVAANPTEGDPLYGSGGQANLVLKNGIPYLRFEQELSYETDVSVFSAKARDGHQETIREWMDYDGDGQVDDFVTITRTYWASDGSAPYIGTLVGEILHDLVHKTVHVEEHRTIDFGADNPIVQRVDWSSPASEPGGYGL